MIRSRRFNLATAALLAASIVLPEAAYAGMGNRGILPHYTPEPCQGDACRADDKRSGLPCDGLLCTFSSAKAMQPPMSATQAAEAQKAAAAAEPIKPLEVAPAKPTKVRKAKAATKTKVSAKTDRAETKEQ